MLFNKWLRFGMSAAVGVLGLAAGLDWSSVVSAGMAGKIVAGIATAKMIMDALAPAVGAIIKPTGGAVVTHS